MKKSKGFCEILPDKINSVDVGAGKWLKGGVEVTVSGTTITDIQRPTASQTPTKLSQTRHREIPDDLSNNRNSNVLRTALSVDENGTINKTVGTEGGSSSTRGAAGGPPYIPVDEFLIGYVTTTTYYGGKQYVRSGSKIGRNQLCPCGSGVKYKRCCIK